MRITNILVWNELQNQLELLLKIYEFSEKNFFLKKKVI